MLFHVPHPATAPAEHREQQTCVWQWLGMRTAFVSNPFPADTTGCRDGSINPSPRDGSINPAPRDGSQLMESKISLRFLLPLLCGNSLNHSREKPVLYSYPATGRGKESHRLDLPAAHLDGDLTWSPGFLSQARKARRGKLWLEITLCQ